MKTKCYISTICYSPIEYVKSKLDDYVRCGKIDFYCFIFHKKEDDEKKDHIHLFIMPATTVETTDFDIALAMPMACDNEEKLGTCGIWKTVGKNNISDFLLYVMHDIMYMRIKGYTERKYTYTENEFYTSNADGLSTLIFDAYHTSTFTFNRRIMEIILKSKDIKQTGKDLVLNGYIPLNSTCSFHHLLQILQGG